MDFNEQNWMIPPSSIGLDDKIFRLVKALYSLKQAPLQCFEKLGPVLASLGFVYLSYEPYVFINVMLNIILLVFLNNITTVGLKLQIKILIEYL